jgi:hypothetical protein
MQTVGIDTNSTALPAVRMSPENENQCRDKQFPAGGKIATFSCLRRRPPASTGDMATYELFTPQSGVRPLPAFQPPG